LSALNTVEQDNEIAAAQRASEARDRARVFRELFTTPHGKLVLTILDSKFQTAAGIPLTILDSHGHSDPLQTFRKLGHHDVMQYIRIQMEFKENEHTGG
jgi:hypothetical protein